jgi:hypothetical protein
MHRQVGDEDAGAHVHRRRAIEQRLAQARRLDLDDVVARLRQRDADHLERMRLGLRLRRQLDRAHVGGVIQKAHAARLHRGRILRIDLGVVGVLVLFLLGLGAPVVLGGALVLDGHRRRQLDAQLLLHRRTIQRGLVVARELGEPVDDGRVVGQRQVARRRAAERHRLDAGLALDLAHRQRQHRLGVELEDAEGGRRKLGERRGLGRARLQREHVGVLQLAAGVVGEAGRQLDAQVGLLGQLVGELHRGDALFRLVVARAALVAAEEVDELVQAGLVQVDQRVRGLAAVLLELRLVVAVGADQHHLLGDPLGHRRRELDAQRAHRQAVGARVDALAGEAGGEGRAHGVLQAPVVGAGNAAGRRDALAPHQRDPGLGRRRPRALQRDAARLLRDEADSLQDRVARRPDDDLDRHALADAGELAVREALDAVGRGRAVEQQREDLLLLDLLPLARRRVGAHDGRAAGGEVEPGVRRDGRAGHRLDARVRRDAAARAGRQVLGEVEDPGLVVDPARGARLRAAGRAGDVQRRRQARIAELDHGLAERGPHLAHQRDLATGRHRLQRRVRVRQQGQQRHAQGEQARCRTPGFPTHVRRPHDTPRWPGGPGVWGGSLCRAIVPREAA